MKEFKTYKAAERHLEYRKKCAYKRIKKNGDIILADSSFIGRSFLNDKKYVVFLLIYTKQIIEDIKNMKPFDFDEYEKLLKEIE